MTTFLSEINAWQECIPVGYVSSTAVAVYWGVGGAGVCQGDVWPRVSAQGGYLPDTPPCGQNDRQV